MGSKPNRRIKYGEAKIILNRENCTRNIIKIFITKSGKRFFIAQYGPKITNLLWGPGISVNADDSA